MTTGTILLMALYSSLSAAADDRPGAPAPPPVPRPQQAPSGQQVAKEGKTGDAFWVKGMVRDANGHGLPGARVFARSLFDGGIRLYEEVQSALTDERGAYEIHGRAFTTAGFTGRIMAPIDVFVIAKGHPPAMAAAPRRRDDDGPATLDVTVAGRAGAARITVLKDGKPLANASVALNLELNVYPVASRRNRGAATGPERAALDDAISPTAQTDADGVARFSDLLPGLYQVRAVNRAEHGAARARDLNSGYLYGRAGGLAVSVGTEARTTLNLLSDFRKVQFLILRPDGQPVTGQVVSLLFGTGGRENPGGFLHLDGRGIGEFAIFGRGLWRVTVRFRDAPVNSFPVTEEPYYEAETLLPLSPGQALKEPIRMAGVLRGPGSSRARVLETGPPRPDGIGFPPARDFDDVLGLGTPVLGPSSLEEIKDNRSVTVVTDDGETPVFAARAFLFVPWRTRPTRFGISDATGRIAWRTLAESGNPVTDEEAAHVKQPTLVVSLPGRCGATIQPFEERRLTHVVLPVPISAEGTVTIGGRLPGPLDARIRVVAAHQDRGDLNDCLSIESTPTPDGRFSLAGLTAGRYIVQADRDDVWISSPVDLVVEAGKAPPSLALDIPVPGEPVAFELVDEKGQPIAGNLVKLIMPQGPLSGLWPTSWRTDNAGRLTLLGLAAGEHVLSIPDVLEKYALVVRPASGARALTTPRRVTARRPAP